MQLFPDEKIITQSNDKTVTLTTHRLYQEQKGMGGGTTKSIMLEHITSCESENSRSWFWIVIAALGVGGVFYSSNSERNDLMVPSLCVLVISVVLFMATQRATVKIASPSAVMLINVNRMKREKITEFIDQIEQTKHQRISSLGSKGVVS